MPTRSKVLVSLLSLVAVAPLTACGGEPTPPPVPVTSTPAAEGTPSADAAPTGDVGPDGQAPSTGKAYDGKTTDETITANKMSVQVPKGIRIPPDSLVTQATKSNVMIGDQDPAAVTQLVEQSAKDAGYTVYAEGQVGKLFVGNGNAVLFMASPGAQQLTWGPEAMKDDLKDAVG